MQKGSSGCFAICAGHCYQGKPLRGIFFLFFCNVALGYVTISQTKQISKLESELETVRNKQLFIKADISRLTREETMRTRLEELNSTVTEKEDQPFVIYYGRDNKN